MKTIRSEAGPASMRSAPSAWWTAIVQPAARQGAATPQPAELVPAPPEWSGENPVPGWLKTTPWQLAPPALLAIWILIALVRAL